MQGIGLDPETDDAGVVYTSQMRSTVWRSLDDGETWTEISPPDAGRWDSSDGFLAVGPEGSVYVANAYGRAHPVFAPAGPSYVGHNSLALFRSDDQGDSWERLAPPQVGQPVHRMWIVPGENGAVHATIATLGPDDDSQPLWYLRSEDKGQTWRSPELLHPSRSFGSDLVLEPDGALSIALWTPREDPDWRLIRSTDDGRTWEEVPMFGEETYRRFASSWQSLAADPGGTLYFTWVREDGDRTLAYYSYTEDGPDDWVQPRAVTGGEHAQMLAWLDARAPGEVAFSWYEIAGTGDENEVAWYPAYTRLYEADTPEPSIERGLATSYPIHEGAICTSGICAGGERGGDADALLDFTWIAHDADGTPHMAFASSRWGGVHGFPVYVQGPAPEP